MARTTTYHAQQLIELIKEGILHPGFSVIEVMTQCPTYFGRKNKLGGAVEMLRHYKEITTPKGSKAKQANPELIERGVLHQIEQTEYCDAYEQMTAQAQKGK